MLESPTRAVSTPLPLLRHHWVVLRHGDVKLHLRPLVPENRHDHRLVESRLTAQTVIEENVEDDLGPIIEVGMVGQLNLKRDENLVVLWGNVLGVVLVIMCGSW